MKLYRRKGGKKGLKDSWNKYYNNKIKKIIIMKIIINLLDTKKIYKIGYF